MRHFLKYGLFYFILLFSVPNSVSQHINFHGKIAGHQTGTTISFGLYESYHTTYFDLKTSSSIPIFDSRRETPIYGWLFSRLLKPRFLFFQSSLYPLVTTSSYLETFHPQTFNQFEIWGMNTLRAIGSGPEEPCALSLLFGNFVFMGYKQQIDSSTVKLKQSGSALVGFLISTGHWHIYDNIRIIDRWWQFEIILKGIINQPKLKKISWNFRIGTKLHDNPIVPDVISITLQRDHLAWRYNGFSVLRNSKLKYEAHFPVGKEVKYAPMTIRQLFSYGKKIPITRFGRYFALRLGGGILWEWVRLYDHENRVFQPEETTHLVWLLQPSIEF